MSEAFWEELPLGLSMALARNPAALDYFNGLSPQEQKSFIDSTRHLQSKEEMRRCVDNLPGNIQN